MSDENLDASKIVAQPGTAEDFIRMIKAEAWDEGAKAAATELDGPEYWLPPEDKFPNPYREPQ